MLWHIRRCVQATRAMVARTIPLTCCAARCACNPRSISITISNANFNFVPARCASSVQRCLVKYQHSRNLASLPQDYQHLKNRGKPSRAFHSATTSRERENAVYVKRKHKNSHKFEHDFDFWSLNSFTSPQDEKHQVLNALFNDKGHNHAHSCAVHEISKRTAYSGADGPS